MYEYNFNTTPGIDTYPCRASNRITKDYYWFLVGEINRGTIKRCVCRRHNTVFNVTDYYLISDP